MNSKVFTQFRDPVNSYPLGEMNLGMFRPGRYSGFDQMTGSSLSIKITHAGRIKKSSPTIGGVITEALFGTLLMPTGCTIQTEVEGAGDGHAFVIDSNTGNANPRYDLVVCEHEYFQIEGGSLPIFFIQKGANDGLVPVLAQPKKQVIIGIIKSEPNGNSFGQLTYVKSLVPVPGDQTDTELRDDHGITQQIQSQGIQQVITNNPIIANESNIQISDLGIFQLIRNIVGSVNSRFYASFTINHAATQVAGTTKFQLGIQSVLGGWALLKFNVGSTVFEDIANSKGIEYSGNYATAFDANDRAIPDVGWVKGKIPSGVIQSKYVDLSSWTVDRQYTVATGLNPTDNIISAIPFLRCLAANHNYAVGDMIAAPSVQPIDSNRTAGQGLVVQFKPTGNSPLRVIIHEEIITMEGWTADGGVTDQFQLSGNTSQWAIRILITYTS